jgi:hypothetical protein
VESARKVKEEINDFDKKYEILFDNLRPRTFKYTNREVSWRTHYGMILDELKEAMDMAGITSQECGAYCLDDINQPDGKGGIRYDEFIPLNIWQIQKLKPRVSALEQTILNYEARISSLESELQNLKKS